MVRQERRTTDQIKWLCRSSVCVVQIRWPRKNTVIASIRNGGGIDNELALIAMNIHIANPRKHQHTIDSEEICSANELHIAKKIHYRAGRRYRWEHDGSIGVCYRHAEPILSEHGVHRVTECICYLNASAGC